MIALAIPVFLACLLEFSEALAAVFAAASRPGAAVPAIIAALVALAVVCVAGAFSASFLHALPSRPVHAVVGVLLLGIGVFWLKGAF
ncbi:MAG: hypothetical protein ACRD6W_11510 [Nitrososphaerales archaeon]